MPAPKRPRLAAARQEEPPRGDAKRPCCSEQLPGRDRPAASSPGLWGNSPGDTAPPVAPEGGESAEDTAGSDGGSGRLAGGAAPAGAGREQQDFVAWVLTCLDCDDAEGGWQGGTARGDRGAPLTLERVLAGAYTSPPVTGAGLDTWSAADASPAAAATAAAAAAAELEGPQTPSVVDGGQVSALESLRAAAAPRHCAAAAGSDRYGCALLGDAGAATWRHASAPEVEEEEEEEEDEKEGDAVLRFLIDSLEDGSHDGAAPLPPPWGGGAAGAPDDITLSGTPCLCRPTAAGCAGSSGRQYLEAAGGGGHVSSNVSHVSSHVSGHVSGHFAGPIVMSGLPAIDPLTEELARFLEEGEGGGAGGGGCGRPLAEGAAEGPEGGLGCHQEEPLSFAPQPPG